MFDEILNLVKEHMGNNPQVAQAIPPEQQDAVHQEIATHINNGLQNQQPQGGGGGILSSLQNAVGGGGMLTSAIEGGLVSSLANKFGLSPMATGAIAGALPGLLQKLANRNGGQNPQQGSGGLGSFFGR